MLSKKGQSMSINVIIVAVLALIVLVILIAIFTGRIGVFESGLSKAGQTDLPQLRLTYGDCAPGNVMEERFNFDNNKAVTTEEKAAAKDNFEQEIATCKQYSDKN